MNGTKRKPLAVLAVTLALVWITVLPAVAKEARTVDFSHDTQGAEARSFSSLVGVWHVEKEGPRAPKCVDYLWTESIEGRLGLWSKADSYVFFDKVTAQQVRSNGCTRPTAAASR